MTGNTSLVPLFAGSFLFEAEIERQIFHLCFFNVDYSASLSSAQIVFLPNVQHVLISRLLLLMRSQQFARTDVRLTAFVFGIF